MNKILAISAITLVAVIMGMSTVAPAFAVPSGGISPACDALEDAQDKAGNQKAKDAIQRNLEKLGCIDTSPCSIGSTVHANIDC